MENDPLTHYIPRKLDAPPKFLWWDWDVALIWLSGLGFGIIAGGFFGLFGCVGVSTVLAYFVNKKKSGKRPGFSAHAAYWHAGFGVFRRKTPPSHIRDFFG